MHVPALRRAHLAAITALSTLIGTAAVLGSSPAAGAATSAAGPRAASASSAAASAKPTVVYQNLALMNGQTATVFSNGVAEVFSKDRRSVEYRMVPPAGTAESGTAAALPGRGELVWQLSTAPASPYVAGTLEVVLSPDAAVTSAARTVPAATLRALRAATPRPGAAASGTVPRYTTSTGLNRLLAGLGVDRMADAFGASAAPVLEHAAAGKLDLAHTYIVHVTNASVPAAMSALLASGQVEYASPDWTVAPMHTTAEAVPAATKTAAAAMARAASTRTSPLSQPQSAAALPALPGNFALADSEQALLNRPATDWVPAYEALQARYHQLPGAGEIITDVSLGDLDSAGIGSSDPCSPWESAYGPTTIVQDGQRYLDLPSMPLIPAWTASDSATLDPTGEVCGVDPYDSEIDLDFSMMAPLPDSMQRAGEQGSGLTDLLGIAPGASYRLVVPSDTSGSITSIDAAFLAAAQQTPRPNVITASLGFGLDSEGFPTRYLEDDPVTEQLVSTLVHQYHINVSIAAGDGLRTTTNAAVAPSGGAAATNVATPASPPTSMDDVQFSTAPSADPDSGAIDSGAVTLDDIFAAPPQDPANAALAAQQAFPEVRWDGSADFASGFGSRVNLSAPGDNLIAFEHAPGGAADQVDVVDIGGTSASAQEIGAAAAVVQQAARLAGNTAVATSPVALRAYLARTATPVPPVSQADQDLNVGPQLDLGAAVTGLLREAGYQLPAGVAGVAVEQRQPLAAFDTFFTTFTSPADISLAGAGQNALVTIAPDWTGLPAGTSYRLYAIPASGPRRLLATGPWARLQPGAILAAAGLAPSPQTAQAVSLAYVASTGSHVRAQASIPLTFSPVSGTPIAQAPVVAPVIRGTTITVHYDLAGQTQFTDPVLEVSAPGRVNPLQNYYHPTYSVPLTATSGTVQIPVSALQGGGVYGIGIQATPTDGVYSDFAVTRVQAAPSDARPPAPLLAAPGSPAGHLLTIPYGGKFTVSWNVRNVPHAAGATLEISAGGPNIYGSYSTFNNPNGTIRDDDGQDSGSVYFARLPATAGSIAVSGLAAGLDPTLYHNVRVIPTLASGAPAGEASDISTVSMDGIMPDDGGYVTQGFGINTNGTDGFLTSNQITASGQLQSSVQTFSQATGAITGTVASSTSGDEYTTGYADGPGIFADDTGMYADYAATGTSVSYQLLHPAGTGTPSGQWTPPASLLLSTPATVLESSLNEDTPADAMLAVPDGEPEVFTSDVQADSFGPAYPIASAVPGFGTPLIFYTGIAQDTATDTAVVATVNIGDLTAGPPLVTVNLASGQTGTIAGVGDQLSAGLAVNSLADTAAGPQAFGIGLYNLAAGTGTFVPEPGFDYVDPVADPSNGDYIIQEDFPPGSFGSSLTLDNNALSAEVIVNGQGQILQRIERFNFLNVSTDIAGTNTQLNPTTGTGYTFGLDGLALEPFSY